MPDVQDQRDNNDNRPDRPGGITGKGFQPGRSGNPGGRPKGTSLTARLNALLDAHELDGRPIEGGKQVADLVAEAIVRGALGGDVKFLGLLLDRVEGKALARAEATVSVQHGPFGEELAEVLKEADAQVQAWRLEQVEEIRRFDYTRPPLPNGLPAGAIGDGDKKGA